MAIQLRAECRFYLRFLAFRLREPFSDFRATGITYLLYCFFVWLLSHVWLKFNAQQSHFTFAHVFLYIGVAEMLFMSFLSTHAITSATEDFALFLARPRSWLGREIAGHVGMCLGKRLLFTFTLFLFAILLGVRPPEGGLPGLLGRVLLLCALLAPAQALLATLFSSLRLSYPQTDYFIYPFSKLFLALGGVFGPLSDYGEPWRSLFLQLPGADLFFQPAHFAVTGRFYETGAAQWLLRLALVNAFLLAALLFFYRRGRSRYLAWGG